MLQHPLTRLLVVAIAAMAASGCGRVVFNPAAQQQQPLSLTPAQQQALAAQQQQMQQRADALDRDNRELEALLAQSRQQMQLMRDQVVATQDQLKATTDRLASLQNDNNDLRNRTQALTASSQFPSHEGLRPNNTLLRPLNLSSMPGVSVRQDGDTIRVSVAADQLFHRGTSQFQQGGDQILRTVATEIVANYPEHLIGIEGHTDNTTPPTSQFPTPHHLSVAQATMVYELLRQQVRVAPNQLFVIGHGANHPLASNGTEAGQQQNRRIELVVYPETIRR